MKNLLPVCLLPACALAAIQNVSVVGTTATQAIIQYQAPDNNPCVAAVSEVPGLSPLVNDVDPAKFASASSDTRDGSVSNGVNRLFVIGKRAAEMGLDGTRYSRALQTFTQHYYRVTCPSTGDVVSGTFQTSNIPFGSGYAEAEAIDPKKPGSYALPTLSSSDRSKWVIDPQTGLAVKPLTLPHDVVAKAGGPLSVARGSSWSNLSNLSTIDGTGATISGGNGKLFLALPSSSPYFNSIVSWANAYQNHPQVAFGYYQPHLIAAVNPGGTAPANPEDAKIQVCLTMDGVNCYAGSSQYEARLTTSYADQVFGSTNTIDLWQNAPGATTPNFTQQFHRSGSVMCDGSPVVKLVNGDVFGVQWGAGSGITINNVDYPIGTVDHTARITLTGNCSSAVAGTGAFDTNSSTFRSSMDLFATTDQGRVLYVYGVGGGGGDYVSTIDRVIDARSVVLHDKPAVTGVNTNFGFPVPYIGYNFGVLVWKKTASADTIAIDYGSAAYGLDFYNSFTVGGGYKLCSTGTVTGPNGNQGYNCAMPSSGQLYWVDMESGETHYFGNLNTNPNVGCSSASQIFDPNDPDKYYCAGTGAVYITKYYGNHGEPVSLNPEGNMLIFQGLPNCNSTLGPPPYLKQQPCILTKPLTPGTDIGSLTTAFTANPAYAPMFDRTLFKNLQFKDVDEDGNAIFQIWRGAANSVGWNVVFSPAATGNSEGGTSTGESGNHGCVGGGLPGCVIAAMPGWARPGCRWCTVKNGDSPYPGWMSTAVYTWTNNGAGSGPYYVPVIDGTPNGTINFVNGQSSLQPCPVNSFGATGNNCTALTVGSEPLSPNHGSGETGLPGELGAAQLGDLFAVEAQFANGPTEQMRLIAKVPGAQPGTWVYTLWRDVNHMDGHRYASTGPNPTLYTVCASNQMLSNHNSGYVWYWNFKADPHGMNSTGSTIPPDGDATGDHFYWDNGNGGFSNVAWGETRCAGAPYNCYNSRLLKNRPFEQVIMAGAEAVMTKNIAFAHGSADSSALQSHATGGGSTASADRFTYMFDGRTYIGGIASGSMAGSGSNPASLVGGQLYKFTRAAMPNLDLPFRKIYPTAAFTGQLPLVDISSPATGDVIGTTASDSFKYCIAAASGECRNGSSVGDVYVNAPHVRYPFCVQSPQNGNLSDEYDFCISGATVMRDAIMQIDLTQTDMEGRFQRLLTKFNRARVLSVFYSPYLLPNGKWMIFESQLPGDGSVNKEFLLAKIPPPGTADNINRLDFVPISITLPAVTGATQVFVRFGYAENGLPGQLFCTSRAESCVVGSQTASTDIDPTNPFFFETTEAANWNPMPCSSGCTVNIPGIPQRVLYYQFVYKNGATTTYTSPVSATLVP